MALPHNVARDYAGGVVQGVQITAAMGSTDLSFTIVSTTGWVNAAGNALGTVGPFTVVIDQGSTTVEKILCSSVNLTSGLVTVYNSGGTNGRGYDQTTAQAHVPGTTSGGVQPCWSAVEAAEANAAAVYGPGGGGAIIGLTGNPAGRVYASSGTAVTGGATAVTLNTTSYVAGTMTFTSSSGTGLHVGTTGYYAVNAQVKCVGNTTAYSLIAAIMKNNSGTPLTYGTQVVAAASLYQASVATDIIHFVSGDVINLAYIIGASTAFQIDPGGASNYISASLVSA